MDQSSSRADALTRAARFFDDGTLKARLAALISIPSTAQDPAFEAALHQYLDDAIRPWLERLGFAVVIHPNPSAGYGPILTAERHESDARPTILLYGHGDTVRGMDEQWSEGLSPWVMTERDNKWYGRGTADNKGQHVINLMALEAVLEARGGILGGNVKFVLEMAEERGSQGLRAFIAQNAAMLAADALIASDGPRVAPDVPTIATGTRGTFHFDLVIKLREGGVHSGHWGGLTADPAIILAHALACMMDRNGKILVRDWLPQNGLPAAVRGVLAGCEVRGGGDAATVDAGWGEPGLSPAEKIYGWNSLIILAMTSGQPGAPVNAVAPDARAHCQIRYTVDTDPDTFVASLRRHLDAEGWARVLIENAGTRMPASRTAPDAPWVQWARQSIETSLSKPVQVIPNSSGGLPGDVFVDHLHVPLVWIPHSYNGCQQHGPDEHLLLGPAREGLLAFAGIWWDLGEKP